MLDCEILFKCNELSISYENRKQRTAWFFIFLRIESFISQMLKYYVFFENLFIRIKYVAKVIDKGRKLLYN